MKSFIIALGDSEREELYSDMHEDLVAFIIMEAVFNVVRDIPSAVRAYTLVVDTAEEYADDPDTNLMVSVDFLTDVMKGLDAKAGVDVEAPDYLGNLKEMISVVSAKLCIAAETITVNNDIVILMSINETLNSPEFLDQLNFTTTHLGNKVMFTLSGPEYVL